MSDVDCSAIVLVSNLHAYIGRAKCMHIHAVQAVAQVSAQVQCSADLKVLGGRLAASCEGGSKLGRAVLS